MNYDELLEAVRRLRDAPQLEDRDDVPVTLPVGRAVGREVMLPLEGRQVRTLIHRPGARLERYPVYFNFHGGGMVKGSPEMDEFICRRVSERLNCVVVNVDYRLAPEHPFPAGLEDCYGVIAYTALHSGEYSIDVDRMAVGGQSAGGNFSAAVSILAQRRREFHLVGQVLVYAGLNFGDSAREPVPEHVVPKSTSRLYRECYGYGGGDMNDPLASPVNATMNDLKGLPPALVITAELDSLAIDAERYALNLARAGTFVSLKRYLGVVHGFTHRGYRDEPAQAIELIAHFLKDRFNQS